MKLLNYTLAVLITILSSLLFLPMHSNSLFAVHEEDIVKEKHEAHDALPGEVPFDRPVEEIQKYLAPMRELDLFPCSDCHDEDWEADPERRELEDPHNEIPGKFVNHDSENRWCLDCHSVDKRDKFRLLNGALIDYNEYYRVCEQCHKRVYREWKMGVHGKRTGYWNGEKQWMHCTQCHDPHNPPYKPITPEPAPNKPLGVRAASSDDSHSSGDTH